MKKIILLLAISLCGVSYATTETKKVCVEQKDAKTGKSKEVCKNVKVHAKLEGTKIPPKK